MTTRTLACTAGLALAAVIFSADPSQAKFGESDQDRQAHWVEIEKMMFNGKTARVDDAAVKLDAPERALDASLVPMAITLANPRDVKGLYLVIDDNPSPVAAHFTFGPAADPREIKLRVRVNAYTDVHAVAVMKDGTLVEATKFVKASGGCSAPMGMTDEEAMKGMGEMRLKVAADLQAGQPANATLMIRHPNFNGMQMNQVTRDYTPARYIQTVDLKSDGQLVFDLESDISLASNPVISFAFIPATAKGDVKVDVKDSQNGQWSKSFDVPSASD